MQKNFVNLSGFIYNPQEFTTQSGKTITKFGMKVYCGKDKSGKSKYEFVNVKLFDKLPQVKEIDMAGHITIESYTKDNVTHKSTVIIADKVVPIGENSNEGQEETSEFKDDSLEDLPF